jgi:hypothetical protein
MYSFRASDGKYYGPVPLETLRQWVAESRVVPTSTIIDHESGRECFASEIPNLFPTEGPPKDWSTPPPETPYPRGPGYSPSAPNADLSTGWTLFGVGVFGCLFCGIVAWICFPLAIANANKALAIGDQRATTLKTLSIVFLVLSIVGTLASLAFYWPLMFGSRIF